MRKVKLFLLLSIFLVKICYGKEIDSKTDLLQEESSDLMAEHRSVAESEVVPPPRQERTSDLWPERRFDVPQIKTINVKCEKNQMKVNIEFDRPFHGTIFSKGHFNDAKCTHLPAGSGHLVANFDIFLGACGMTSSESTVQGNPSSGLFIENTLVIQYDPQVQEVWDQARRLRCTWYDFYEKSVSFRPFNVDMMDAVTANFLGDNIQCWMQIQAGKGPWASEVTGIVKIGQTMTMVLAIKDDENKFDMLVRNCVAHDGKNQPIQLIDDSGCVQRPKIISKFQKVKNFGASASVVSYAYFQAFKFPDSMNVHFQCVIQVCRYECPEPKCPNNIGGVSVDDVGQSLHDIAHHQHVPNNPVAIHPREPFQQPEESRLYGQHNRLLTTIDPSKVTILKVPALSGNQFFATTASNTMFMKRQGESTNKPNQNWNSGYRNRTSVLAVGGKPRSLATGRQKRQALRDSYTDVKTGKIIHVVAPEDMEVSFSGKEEETRSLASFTDDLATSLLCMSTTSFLFYLVTVLTILCLSSMVAVFFYLRVRAISKTSESLRNLDARDLRSPQAPSTYHFPN